MLEALKELESELAKTLSSFRIQQTILGQPHLVERAKNETERLFQNFTKVAPSERSAYEAALKFLRGQLSTEKDDFEFDMLANAICIPIREQADKKIIGIGTKFNELLSYYETQAKEDNLWRVTWYGLLSAYFSFNSTVASDEEVAGWNNLRSFLERTWSYFSADTRISPDWVKSLQQNSVVLSKIPCATFAKEVLSGDNSKVKALSESLGIPQTSWFWHHLVLEVAREATNLNDLDFKDSLPRLIQLLIESPVYRDEAIKLILTRYSKCANRAANEQLREYVIDKKVWKNPKLKFAGIATSWNQVAEDVWRMVLGWVNETNLRLFFQLLDGRNASDSGRFTFWTKYLHQIGYTKLIFGEYTRFQAKSNKELAVLLSQEESVSAALSSSDSQVDAFLMEIGDLIVVEFSKQPNAAYLYPKNSVPFDIYSKRLSDGTGPRELKAGYYHGAERIIHPPNWEYAAKQKLAAHGIYPDKPGSVNGNQFSNVTSRPISPPSGENLEAKAPSGALFTMRQLHAITASANATIDDRRPEGRLWVGHNQQFSSLGKQLLAYGFVWANKRSAWYYPE